MSCVLTILGKTLDVDLFVEKTGILGFEKKYKGDIISMSRQTKLQYSYASIIISEADFNEIGLQISEAEIFLNKNKSELKSIAYIDGVDFATINFGSDINVTGENLTQTFFFPTTLLLLCAELKLGLELTVYSF
jgi:hypothetical protein